MGAPLRRMWTFASGHLAIILFCVWLVYGNGWEALGQALGNDWWLTDYSRAQILLACAVIYWLRHVLTLFFLLERKVDWPEVPGLLVFMALFEVGLLLLGDGAYLHTIPGSWLSPC